MEFWDVKNWLSDLVLQKYDPVFDEAAIEAADLAFLSEDDLKELGLPIGPRRRVREAIRKLAEQTGPRASVQGPDTPERREPEATAPSLMPQTDAERRDLTVMFVDLVGSTEMATRVDAEDMRDVITGCQNTVAGVVSRFEGFVAKFMGDGVPCHFGWPRAGEDAAVHSVRAGLSIIETVSKTRAPDGTALSTRVGIATGVVI